MTRVRPAQHEDLAVIMGIYNEAIQSTTATFDTEPKTVTEQEAWWRAHHGTYPLLVAENEGVVMGWAALSRWSERCAYKETAENSVYVDQRFRGQGVGSALLQALVDAARAGGFHTLIARIAEGNGTSVRLHEQAGFASVGVLKEVGKKFGRRLDVLLMQKML